MTASSLDRIFRTAQARIIAALAARFRDLDLAEDAFGDACAKAAETWQSEEVRDPAAWLYRVAERRALDTIRKRHSHLALTPQLEIARWDPRDEMADHNTLIPDERLRLIFVCCHPAVAIESRAALTLRLVCGLATDEIARAFLVSEPTLAQRLVRAKRKIAEAGVPFEIPRPEFWLERLDAVLTTVEIAYAKAHEDAAATSAHAGYAPEMLNITRVLAALLPGEADALALAALVRFAEARRPARVDADGAMTPLSEQNPALWDAKLIAHAQHYLESALRVGPKTRRVLHAAIHGVWCARKSLAERPAWDRVLTLYDAMLSFGDNPIVRLNRAVAVAEVVGIDAGLAEIDALRSPSMETYLPYQAARADLLRRVGRREDADGAYAAALALGPAPAEKEWLRKQRRQLAG